MEEEGLIFLDCRIFYKDQKLQFIKHRKLGTKTVLTNFEFSVTCKKYLKNSIFGMLHRERDCCSNNDLFKQSLEELKEVLLKNGYPKKLIEEKIKIFLSDDQKPVRPERIYTLSLEFNSASMEPYVNSLLKKMKNLVPNFIVNVAYKTRPVSHLFSTNAKAKIPYEETSNLCYQFKCPCGSHYVGQTGRTLAKRAEEHQQLCNAKNLYWHIKSCPVFK